MKILVFEYITGGGFNKQELPNSLIGEGSLMLNALLDNLIQLKQTRLNYLEITAMLDWRLDGSLGMAGINIVLIRSELDISIEFARSVSQADLVWPIAPESDGILQSLCQTVETLDKVLLTSPATAVAIASDKFKTYELLVRHHIAAVPTRKLSDSSLDSFKEGDQWMVKPVDGVGCADSLVITDPQDFQQMIARKGAYIIQPHLQGAKISLSCLFKQGRGWLVCANLQHFEFICRQYHLVDIVVNYHPDLARYQPLVAKIALALPDLWGYVGIDLIASPGCTWVLEINPRLTTSFVGIYAALGVNIAEAILLLLQGDPILNTTCNKAITVQAKQEINAS